MLKELSMRFSKYLLTGVAALALVACGSKDEAAGPAQSQSSAQAAKTNSASPLDSTFRLKTAEAVDIDAFFAAVLPMEARPTYDSAAFDDKIGATVVTNLRFADKDDGEGVTVARAEFYGVDLDAVERIKGAEGAGPDAPFEKVFEKVRLLDVSTEGFEDENATVTIDGVEFDGLSVRQGGAKGDGAGEEAARFFNAVSLAGLYFKNIAVTSAAKDAPAIEFSAPDLRIVGLSGGKLGAVIANDLTYKIQQTDESKVEMMRALGPQGAALMNTPLMAMLAPDKQRTTMKSMEWRGIDLSGLLPWGLKGEEPPVTEHDLINLGTAKMSDVETYIGARRAASMKEATISAAEFTWLLPSKFRTDSKGVSYDFTAYAAEDDKDTLAILKQYGLDNVKGDGYAEWIWDPKKGDGDFDYATNMTGLADISMSFGVSGLKLSEIGKLQDNGEKNFFAKLAALEGFSLKIKDDKLLDVIFALSAKQMNGGTAEQLRASAPTMIRLSGAQAAQFNDRVTGYVNAIADFVGEGGSIEISAKPKEPTTFSSLTSGGVAPTDIPDVLNIEVTHDK